MLYRSVIIVISAMLGCFSLGLESRAYAHVTDSAAHSDVFIAHALGGIQGRAYTNSYEAFMENYRKGYRLFETDLMLTADGKLAARHDWSRKLQPKLPATHNQPISLKTFKNSPIYGQYTPLSWEDIIQLMQKYPDFYLITDTKETDVAKVRLQFEYMVKQVKAVDAELLQRIMPEIYSPEMYDTVMSIYPFPHKIYSLYQTLRPGSQILDFVKGKQFTFVAMPAYRLLLSPTLPYQLGKMNLKSYVHTVNMPLMMTWMREIGVYGFYTDSPQAPDGMAAQLMKGGGGGILQYLFVIMCSIMLLYYRQKVNNHVAKSSARR